MPVIRTPDERFADLPGHPFAPHYEEVENPEGGSLRLHFVDEGPARAPTVLLLHGEPTWSYLYRKMIPAIAGAGLRAVAPDHVGFGRSDKLTDRAAYSYERHVAWIHEFVRRLDLREITLVCQDWGGPIGLSILAADPERFARVVAANTILHTADPALEGSLAWSAHGVGESDVQISEHLLNWITHSQRALQFDASQSLAGSTLSSPPPEVLRAYDAPFPDERFKAGMRQFPALIPITRTDPGAEINRATWKVLEAYDRPFLTAFSDGDPSTRGWEGVFQRRIPGARGQPHATIRGAGHFLQEDRGEELARVVVDFVRAS